MGQRGGHGGGEKQGGKPTGEGRGVVGRRRNKGLGWGIRVCVGERMGALAREDRIA